MEMWYYGIRAGGNRLVESKGRCATEKEAMTAGGQCANMLTSPVGAPGGSEIFSGMAGRRNGK